MYINIILTPIQYKFIILFVLLMRAACGPYTYISYMHTYIYTLYKEEEQARIFCYATSDRSKRIHTQKNTPIYNTISESLA